MLLMQYVRSTFHSLVKPGPRLALVLILLFGVPRFFLVLTANITGSYQQVSFIFLSMIAFPFILLNKEGRRLIGIKKPANWKWLILSFLLGIGISCVIYSAGTVLYRQSTSNWFVYISQSYTLPDDVLNADRLLYFAIFSVVSMTFSPVGEEFLYRGLIHESFATKYDDNRASQFDSLAFSLTHLAHFGIVFNGVKWQFLPVPALLWVILMFVASRLFYVSRVKTGSIWGAVVSHAGFNLAMNYFIFYHIL